MSLKNRINRSFFRSIQFRIGFVFSLVFILLFIALTAWILYSTYQALIEDEVQFLYNRAVTFYAQYETEGLEYLYERARIENERLPYMAYFVRFNDPKGKEIFFYTPPGWDDFDYDPLIEAVAEGDHRPMMNLSSNDHTRNLIVVILPLSDGSTLQCGVASNSQYRLITIVRRIITRLLLILVGIAFLMGLFVTTRSLKPLSDLNREIEKITETGEISLRMSLRDTGDQIDVFAERINRMLDRIEELVEGLKGTLDNTAHDLRTPLTRLMGRAELAMEGSEEEKTEALATCMEESRHILTMLNTLMDISAAEKGLIKIREEPICLNHILEQVYELYEMVAEDRGIDLALDMAGELNARADWMRLNQAVANLVDNALKFTPPGGQVTLGLRQGPKEAVISVSDTGPGIPEEDIRHIWKRLYRGEKSRTTPGLGLGLSMVKAVIEAHGGRGEAKNRPEGGAVFFLYLPVS